MGFLQGDVETRINEAGLRLLKEFEGCSLTAYRCSAGTLTIGYGHTGLDVKEGMQITSAEADALLAKDLQHFEKGVGLLVKVPLNSNQFSALVCFAYNVGLTNLAVSTLLDLLNKKKDCSQEFLKWNRVQGKVLPGLTRRREAERELFLMPLSECKPSGTL